MSQMFVYIAASRSQVLYVGVTNDLVRRMYEHRQGLIDGFTSRYNVNRLVYFETTPNAIAAIEREKQLKAWRREKKVRLIERANAEWQDLSEGWFETPAQIPRSAGPPSG